MAIQTKAQLSASNNTAFPDNTTGFITPEILRGFNTASIDSYAALSGSNTFVGNQVITGSVIATSFTGSLQGTSSWANNAITASFANSFNTGSLLKTASVSNDIIDFTKGDNTTFSITVNNVKNSSTASVVSVGGDNTNASRKIVFVGNTVASVDAQLLIAANTPDLSYNPTTNVINATASYANFAVSASYASTSTSASYAATASFVQNAVSSSYASNATSASYALTSTSASYASASTSASYALVAESANTIGNSTINGIQTYTYSQNGLFKLTHKFVTGSFNIVSGSWTKIMTINSSTSSWRGTGTIIGSTNTVSQEFGIGGWGVVFRQANTTFFGQQAGFTTANLASATNAIAVPEFSGSASGSTGIDIFARNAYNVTSSLLIDCVFNYTSGSFTYTFY